MISPTSAGGIPGHVTNNVACLVFWTNNEEAEHDNM